MDNRRNFLMKSGVVAIAGIIPTKSVKTKENFNQSFYIGASRGGTPVRKNITVFGQQISYLEAGTGTNHVLLLHGITSDASNWTSTLAALSDAGFHAIAIDHLGFGQSSKPNIPITPQTLADFAQALIQELGWKTVKLIGQSMGGHVAGLTTLQIPQQIEKLVLVNAGYGLSLPPASRTADLGHAKEPGGLWALNPGTLAQAEKMLAMVFYNKKLFVTPENVKGFFMQRLQVQDGWTIRTVIESWERRENTLDDRLSKLGGRPVLVVQAREDEIAPFHLGERFHKGIPGSTFLVIEQSGHNPPVEKADLFNKELIGFLSK
jgi:pimeloyl-ACP methyl ester carboxylesterase